MTRRGKYDHELKIESTTKTLELMRRADGSTMYQVEVEVLPYRNPLRFIQDSWLGGHGQHDFMGRDLYYEGQSIDTLHEGRVFLGPEINQVKEDDATNLDTAPAYFAWVPWATPQFIMATAGKIYAYNSVDSDWEAKNTVSGITDLTVHDSIVYAARGSAANFFYAGDGSNISNWTVSNKGTSGGYIQKFLSAKDGVGLPLLLGAKLPNVLYQAVAANLAPSDATNTGTWDSGSEIGDTSNDIINLFLHGEQIMVGREDGLFHYDKDGIAHPLMDDLEYNRSTLNFKYVAPWQTGTYFALSYGMGEITSYNAFDPMGPLHDIGDIDKKGDIKGIAADKDFLYVAVKEGTNHIIYKGREARRGEGLRWEWCPWIFLGTNACNAVAIAQHSDTDRRLWFGYGPNSAYVKLSDNPTEDSNYLFAASGWLRMSYDKGTNPEWIKMFQSLVVETKGCEAATNITPKYRKDTDTSATGIATAIAANGTLVRNFGAAIACNRIQFELHMATGTNTKTPELSYFEARGIEKPEIIRIHDATYRMGDTASRRAKTIRDFLRGGRTSTSLIKLADLRYGDTTGGTTYAWVVMEPGFPQEVEIVYEKGAQPELGMRCRMREVSYTIS